MKRQGIPSAPHETFNASRRAEALKFIEANWPVVVKASGLCAGKGVLIPATKAEAVAAFDEMQKSFGTAGDEVVIEKRRLQDAGVLGRYEHPFARVAEARDRLMYQRVESVSRGAGGQHLPCTAGELSAVIFEDGTVRACEVLDDDIGNLNDVDWDLSKLWGSTAAEGLRHKIKETRCECTWECAQADNVLFQPRLWLKLAAGAVKA